MYRLARPTCRVRSSRLFHATNPHVLIDVSVVPLKNENGASVSAEVAIVHRLIQKSGLKHQLHAYGTNIEGPWDDVFGLVKQAHLTLHNDHNVPRISTTMRVGTRLDKESTIDSKLQSLREKI
ncbi:hypothetical protein DIPPA_54968 [Diplonema papillatum]|nr:hypothetical protein DIPPA_54968 [Diplonema papillatum]